MAWAWLPTDLMRCGRRPEPEIIDEAAWANPTGSVEQHAFAQLADNNWSWLVSQIPAWTQRQGEAYGYVPGTYGDGSGSTMAPWQQDYFASTAIQAAQMGNADALTFLNWQANFLVGRFLNGANGFNPHDGATITLSREWVWDHLQDLGADWASDGRGGDQLG